LFCFVLFGKKKQQPHRHEARFGFGCDSNEQSQQASLARPSMANCPIALSYNPSGPMVYCKQVSERAAGAMQQGKIHIKTKGKWQKVKVDYFLFKFNLLLV